MSGPQRVLIWPNTPAGKAERDAYSAWADAHAGEGTEDPASWRPFHNPGVTSQVDFYGQPWCTECAYRPDWDEPAGGEARRPNAVIHDSVVPPAEPDPEF